MIPSPQTVTLVSAASGAVVGRVEGLERDMMPGVGTKQSTVFIHPILGAAIRGLYHPHESVVGESVQHDSGNTLRPGVASLFRIACVTESVAE